MRTITAVIGITAVLSSCATSQVGRPIDPKAVAQLKVGETTAQQALKLLGKPFMRQIGGVETWTYMYATSNTLVVPAPFYTGMNMSQQNETLVLQFKSGVLSQIGVPDYSAPQPAKVATSP